MKNILILICLSPLLGALIAGFLGGRIGRSVTHWLTIGLVGLAFILSCIVAKSYIFDNHAAINVVLYHWAVVGDLQFNIGFLIDKLTVVMLLVITFVSTLVHIYSIGYMAEEEVDHRFFCYISAFTFSMLTLVMANNFLLLFFGWEAVGLVSYLLIGYYFSKESAIYMSLKAFLANRVGDFGFLLGIAGVLLFFGSIDYAAVFPQVPGFVASGKNVIDLAMDHDFNALTVICLCLFLGAMGKSAQIPLHVWLEGSMEGPTPISALIHAATMVTAGVFMCARLSPMFEYSEVTLSTVMIIGGATCFFMGILGIVQTDIKRVIAYSTLSQLGYMICAQGVSAYPAGMFHLMTHACFKALLFLAAGSVILGMHHEQDMRKMGGLARKMPVTYVCMLIGGLALAAIPPFAGYFSKDMIIEAVGLSTLPGSKLASFFVVGGALLTAWYTFRMIFMVFHGKPRMSQEAYDHVHESHWTVLLPLVALSVPSVVLGWIFFKPALNGFFGDAILILPKYDVIATLRAETAGPTLDFVLHSVHTLPFWLAVLGVVITWFSYVKQPSVPGKVVSLMPGGYNLLVRKYWFDEVYDVVFVRGSRLIGNICWRVGDVLIIDTGIVHGIARVFRVAAGVLRRLQTGYLYHYAFVMILGLLALLFWAMQTT